MIDVAKSEGVVKSAAIRALRSGLQTNAATKTEGALKTGASLPDS